MTVSTIARAATSNKAIKVAPASNAKPKPIFAGKANVLRAAAFEGVAAIAFAEGTARAETLTRLRLVLGKAPTALQVDAIRAEYLAGRVAARLKVIDSGDYFATLYDATNRANGEVTVSDRIVWARDLIANYAAPVKDGTTANKLRKGQKGRRTIEQHKAIRAAEVAWVAVKAELGEGDGQTSTAKRAAEKAKRSTKSTPVRGNDKAGTGITHSELIKADGPMTRDAALDYMLSMSATLLAFANKHAKVVPTDAGSAIKRFQSDMVKAVALAKSVNA